MQFAVGGANQNSPGVLDLEGLPASILAITNSIGIPEDPMVDEAIQLMLQNPRFLIEVS